MIDQKIQTGTLYPDGTFVAGPSIQPSRCSHFILMAEHYRPDGSCKCNSASHRAMMIAEWEYTAADFAEAPTCE